MGHEYLRLIPVQRTDSEMEQNHSWLRGCSCYLTSPSTKNTLNRFRSVSCTRFPCIITMVITHPCDFGHPDPTLVPENRSRPKLICSIIQNPPWSFRVFFLFYLPFINLSIFNSTCQLTSPELFILI